MRRVIRDRRRRQARFLKDPAQHAEDTGQAFCSHWLSLGLPGTFELLDELDLRDPGAPCEKDAVTERIERGRIDDLHDEVRKL